MSQTSHFLCASDVSLFIVSFDFYLIYLLSSNKSDSLDDESGKLGSDSGSSGMHSFRTFSLRFDDYGGSVSVLGSEALAPTGVNPNGNIFRLTCSYQQESCPAVVDSSNCFGAQIPYFLSKF